MYPGSPYPPPPMLPGTGSPGYPVPNRNALGIVALALGVVALVTAATVVGGLTFGLTAVVLGALAYRRVRAGMADNKAVSISAMVLGVVAIVVSIGFIAFWSHLFGQIGLNQYQSCVSHARNDPQAIGKCISELQDRVQRVTGPTATGNP